MTIGARIVHRPAYWVAGTQYLHLRTAKGLKHPEAPSRRSCARMLARSDERGAGAVLVVTFAAAAAGIPAFPWALVELFRTQADSPHESTARHGAVITVLLGA